MSIFSRIRAAFKALSGEQLVMTPHFETVSFSMFTQEETAADLLKHFVHWVYICSTKNASAVASVPLRLYVTTAQSETQYRYLRKGIDTRPVKKARLKQIAKDNPILAQRISKSVEVEEVVEHPFLQLWANVNPFMNGFEMVELLDIYSELVGDSFLYPVKDEFGIPRELWVLQSQYVTVVPDKQNFIKGYLYGTSKQDSVALAANEVIHFKFPNPHSLFTGFSPVQGGISAVKRKEDMDAYEDSLLQNNARPDFLILAKKKMSEFDKRALREQWQQLYGTRRGRGRPALLDTDAEIKELGFSPKDVGFLQGQKLTKEEICGAFGVPVSKVVPDAKYANAEVGDREWKSDTIRPRLRRFDDKLNEQLLPMFDARLFIAHENPVPEDKEFELKREETYLKNAVITIDEVRETHGLEEVPWGKVPLLPMNMFPLGSAPAAEEELAIEETSAKTRLAVVQRRALSAARTKVKLPPMPKVAEMAQIMRRVYKGIEREALANLERNKPKQSFEETYYFMPDLGKWALEVEELMGPPIRSQLVTGGQYGLDTLNMGLRFDVMNPEVQQWLSRYVSHFSLTTTRKLGLAFSKTMLEGIQDGETIFELRKRTERFFGQMELYHSEMIARSESSRAAHHGMIQGWKDSNVVSAKVWRAQSGACQFCEPLDGKVVELDENFFEQGASVPGADGGRLSINYEEIAAPPLHPNCECTVVAQLID